MNLAIVKTKWAKSKYFPLKPPELVLQGGSTIAEIVLDVDSAPYDGAYEEMIYEDEILIRKIETDGFITDCFDDVLDAFFKEIEDFRKEFEIEKMLINYYAIWRISGPYHLADDLVKTTENYAEKHEIPFELINVYDSLNELEKIKVKHLDK